MRCRSSTSSWKTTGTSENNAGASLPRSMESSSYLRSRCLSSERSRPTPSGRSRRGWAARGRKPPNSPRRLPAELPDRVRKRLSSRPRTIGAKHETGHSGKSDRVVGKPGTSEFVLLAGQSRTGQRRRDVADAASWATHPSRHGARVSVRQYAQVAIPNSDVARRASTTARIASSPGEASNRLAASSTSGNRSRSPTVLRKIRGRASTQ